MNRFLPPFFILFWWLVVAVVPFLRQSVFAAWQNWSAYTDESGQKVTAPPFVNVTPRTAEWLKRSPDDKNLQIYAAKEFGYGNRSNFDFLGQRYPKEVVIVAMQLDSMLTKLKTNRVTGPLTNRNYPAAPPKGEQSPRVEWDKFIALARRGQYIEPDNNYFDWMLMYGLYATKQDKAAWRVLIDSSHSKSFDPHTRERVVSSAQVMKRFYGSPVPPIWLLAISNQSTNSTSVCMRQVTNWTMDIAHAERLRGFHDEAIAYSVLLTMLTGVTRRQSYSLGDSRQGLICEKIALTNSSMNASLPEIDVYDPLVTYQSSNRSLYAYSKLLKNDVIAKQAMDEWANMQQWIQADWYKHDWRAAYSQPIMVTVFANRFQAISLKTLPLILLLGLVSGVLSCRFRAPIESRHLRWYGSLAAVVLLGLSQAYTALIAFFYNTSAVFDTSFTYATKSDLLDCAPTWIVFGVPMIVLCLALHQAGRWQNERKTPQLPFATRLKQMFTLTEDGLPRIDFGGLVSLALRITYYAALITVTTGFCLNMDAWWSQLSMSQSTLATWIMVAALLPALAANWLAWINRPGRGEALRLSFHYIYQMTTGYVIATSILFVAAATLSFSISSRFEHDFEASIQKGSLKIALEELKLQ